MGYTFSPQGTTRDPTKYTLRQCYCAGWKYLTGVSGKFLGHNTGSLDQLNLFEKRIMYAMACNKRLYFSQLFFDQLVESIIGNKKLTYFPYPRFLALIMACTGEGYNVNHGVSIPLPVLSSKIINARTNDGDMHLTQSMKNWVVNRYVVETYDSKEEDDEGNNENGKVDVDGEEDANDEEDESDVDMVEASVKGMTNSP